MSGPAPTLLRESGVLGVFAYVDVAVEALRRLRERGWQAVRVHLPVPRHEILEEITPRAASPVRVFSLVGGVAGTAAGFALASWAGMKMHTYQGLLVGGKPPISIPAYVVIGFELTVLIGALATMAGFLLNARLPNWRLMAGRDHVGPGYDAKFSEDRFGIFVPCDPARCEEVKKLLGAAGAEEVRVEPEA